MPAGSFGKSRNPHCSDLMFTYAHLSRPVWMKPPILSFQPQRSAMSTPEQLSPFSAFKLDDLLYTLAVDTGVTIVDREGKCLYAR